MEQRNGCMNYKVAKLQYEYCAVPDRLDVAAPWRRCVRPHGVLVWRLILGSALTAHGCLRHNKITPCNSSSQLIVQYCSLRTPYRPFSMAIWSRDPN